MQEEAIYENTLAPRLPPRLPAAADPPPPLPPTGPPNTVGPALPFTPPTARRPIAAAPKASPSQPHLPPRIPLSTQSPVPHQPPPHTPPPARPLLPSQPPPSRPAPAPQLPDSQLRSGAGSKPPLPSTSSPSQSRLAAVPVYSPAPVLLPANPATLAEAGMAGVGRLQQGVIVTVFSLKRKPEKMHLVALPDLSLLQCVRSLKDQPEISVDLAHVQEIRNGRRCADFEKYSDEANKEKNELCLVIFYGVRAVPQALAMAVATQEILNHVVAGLTYLVDAVQNQTYQIQRERWFKRQFFKILSATPGRKADGKQEKISVKQLRQWLKDNGMDASKKDIMPVINQLCLSDTIKYGSFKLVLTEIMTAHSVRKRMKSYTETHNGVQCVTPATFLRFLRQEQNETRSTEEEAQAILDQYLEGKESRVSTYKALDAIEFQDFLFSPLNSVVKPETNTVHQDMNQPLTDYWIASSHNTYLTGHQFIGESSEQMYARCLRMGCRCVELDCWDGSDMEPIITHGRCLVGNIKVSDVLKVIKENAWQTSEYPIILSIENHLSLPQQRYLANLLQDIFKDELLKEPIDPNETEMPSPEQLKRKIIIKDKKMKAGTGAPDTDDFQGQRDSKTGTLMMRDPDDKKWYPMTVGLTDTSFFYTSDILDEDDGDVEEDIDYDEYFYDADSDEDEDDLTYQLWYYGDLAKREVRNLLKGETSLRRRLNPGDQPPSRVPKDGAFLVRKSEGTGNDYSLSFIWEGEVKHVRVKTKEENGRTLYTFGNEVWRSTIAELVKYFRTHRLYIANENTHLYLDKPVCKPHEKIKEDWFRPDLNRYTAERLLLRIPKEGVFLVRGGSDPGSLSLSFRHKRKISHFQVTKRGKAYVCGPYRFVSLPKMVEYFRRRPLYRKTKLSVAAREDMAECKVDEDCDIYDSTVYNDPTEMDTYKTVSVRALYDFMGQAAENEMSFTRGAVITNVKEEDKPWWKGDYMDQKQKVFPASYVQVITAKANNARKQSICDTLRGKEDTLELSDFKLDNGPYIENNRTLYCFRIEHPHYETCLQLGCESLLQLEEWVTAIRAKQQRLEVWNKEQQKQKKNLRRAREYSDLIVYFQAVSYDRASPGKHYNISSLTEDKVQTTDHSLLKASRQQMLRVYPKGTRLDSSNYDPGPKWTCGAQMVALNYQTPGLPMQLNQSLFMTNGRSGYVLKPAFMRDFQYNLSNILNHEVPSDVLYVTVTVLAGRNLNPEGQMKGVMRPFVAVSVIGLPMDYSRQRTKPVDEDNALRPQWPEERMKFDVSCPELAYLRFEVLSGSFSETDSKAANVIAQATYPVTALRQGYRSVPLQNRFSENLDMSALLVHTDIKTPKDAEEENLFRVIEESRRIRAQLLNNSSGDEARADQISTDLLKTEMKILKYLQGRNSKDLPR